jgi:hypothetical protein
MSTIKVNALQDTSGNGYYPARAWVNFNGSGTVAIRNDENVASITDSGTGGYIVNFSNNLSTATYSALSTWGGNQLGGAQYGSGIGNYNFNVSILTTGCRVVGGAGSSADDIPYLCFAAHD